jgi:hypothetical protein
MTEDRPDITAAGDPDPGRLPADGGIPVAGPVPADGSGPPVAGGTAPELTPVVPPASQGGGEDPPGPGEVMSLTRKIIAAVTGSIGLACALLLLRDLFTPATGSLPIAETLTATAALGTCFAIGPGKVRRAAAGSIEATALVVAILALFGISDRALTPHDSPSRHVSPGRAVSCPPPPSAARLSPATSPERSDRTSAELGDASIDGAEAADGRPGMGASTVVCVHVTRLPGQSHALWLVTRLDRRPGVTHFLYFPKLAIPARLGEQKITLWAHCPT